MRTRLFGPKFGFAPREVPGVYAYGVPASTGVFTLTGIAATVGNLKYMTGDAGNFTLNSSAVSFAIGKGIGATATPFTLTGIAASLTRFVGVIAATRAYILTGNVVTLKTTRYVVGGLGSFTETGVAAGLYRGKGIVAVVGSFVETGVAVNLKYGQVLTAVKRDFTLTGIDNDLRATRLFTSTVTTFALTGVAATIKPSKAIAGATGVLTLTGVASTLKATRLLGSTVTAFALAGTATGLYRQVVPLAGLPGAYTLTGRTAALLHNLIAPISVGNIALTGNAANLLRGRGLVTVVGAFTYTGIAAGINKTTRILAATTVAYALAGSEVGLSLGNASGHLLRAGRLQFKPRLRGILAVGMSNQLSVRNSNTVVIPGIVDDRDPKETTGAPKYINNLTGTWEIRTLEYPLGVQVANGSVVAVGSGGEYYCTLSNSIALNAASEYWFHAVLTQPVTGYVMDFSVSFAALSRNGNTVQT